MVPQFYNFLPINSISVFSNGLLAEFSTILGSCFTNTANDYTGVVWEPQSGKKTHAQ